MFTFSFGSAFATVSWTGEATSKTLNEAGDYDLNSNLITPTPTVTKGDGAKGITEAYRAELTATAKAEGSFYAPEKAEAVAAIEAYIEALKTVKTAKDAAKLKADLENKVGTWANGKLTEKVANGVLVSLPTQATVRALMTAAKDDSITITGTSTSFKATAAGIAKAKKAGSSTAGDATFDLTRIAKRNDANADGTIDNKLYLPGRVELETAQVDKGSSTTPNFTFELKIGAAATKAEDIFKDTGASGLTVGSKEEAIRDWFLDNGYREEADFDAGSKAFAAALVGVNSAYEKVVTDEADAIQKEIDKYVAAADKARRGLSISEAEGIDALVKKINDFKDKYAELTYAKTLLVEDEFKNAIWNVAPKESSLAANYFDQYAAEVGAVPEVKKLTDADKATVVALYKKVDALGDTYAATWKYANNVDLAKVTGSYDDYKRLNAAYKHFLDADVKAFNALESFEAVTQGTVEGTTNKYYFDASEKNVSAVKAKRAAYDALVSNYGYADIHVNGITYTSAAGSEALILAAEHNQGADAAYDVKDTKKLQAYLNNATLKVTTKALGNSKIRVNARFDAETYKDIVAECGNDYTISYKFYQKSAKATSFKGPKEKSRNYITYTKASLKKGTKYKFQCGVVIKDAQGNVVAEKSYKASTTGSRVCR